MIRRDLDPSARQVAAALAARLDAARGGVTGVMSGDGDVRAPQDTDTGETTPGGGVVGRRGPAASLRDVGSRVEAVEGKIADLQAGVSTQGRWNTVSTSPAPSSASGYPEGAWWTQVKSDADMRPQALWTVEKGAWVTRPLPSSQVIAPYLNSGLIDTSMLIAQAVQSGLIRTAADGKRIVITSGGISGYDEQGNVTIDLDGATNRLAGELIAGGARLTEWRSEYDQSLQRAGIVWGDPKPDEKMTDARAETLPRVVGTRAQDGRWDTVISTGLEGDRQGLIQTSQQLSKVSLSWAMSRSQRAWLDLGTKEASSLYGYSSATSGTSGLQFGNGWVDVLGKLGLRLNESTFALKDCRVGHMRTGDVARIGVPFTHCSPAKWILFVQPYDWSDGAALIAKTLKMDADGGLVALECRGGETNDAGFIALGIRTDVLGNG